MITDRDAQFLKHLRKYRVSTVALLREDVAPDCDAAIVRGRMRNLDALGFAKSFKAQILNPVANSTAPVWTITESGACWLATHMGDMRLLLDSELNARAWQNYGHWAAITALLMKFNKALERQSEVEMTALFFEHDIIRPDENDLSKKFRLYTITSEQPRRIVANPDFAFEIKFGNFRRAYYGEYETGSEESPARCAARKNQGAFGLAQAGLFKRHFPQATDMVSLAFCPNRPWLESMRKAMKDKPGASLWRFAAVDQITAENFLHGDLFYTCADGPLPFVKPASPASPPMPEQRAG
jgi:hypothetical protein